MNGLAALQESQENSFPLSAVCHVKIQEVQSLRPGKVLSPELDHVAHLSQTYSLQNYEK